MKYTTLSEDDMDDVQQFAFGGIANPLQRTMLRGSDKRYLAERQKELDAYESQRQSYNTALQDWQTNVYQPYMSQVNTFNTEAQKYNDEVYNPYKTQYEDYVKAVEAYNAGDRLADYAGPAEPVLAREFSLTAPTAPGGFDMSAPTLPFKVEDVEAYQKASADRAQKDAGARAVAIDVVSNPDQFNFGSMSVTNRFMAEGGEVKGKSAREMLEGFGVKGFTDGGSVNRFAQIPEGLGITNRQIRDVNRAVTAQLAPVELEALKAYGTLQSLKTMQEGRPAGFYSDAISDAERAVERVNQALSSHGTDINSVAAKKVGLQEAEFQKLMPSPSAKLSVTPPVTPTPVTPTPVDLPGAIAPPDPTPLAPITPKNPISVGPSFNPIGSAANTLAAISANPGLSPLMLGGLENTGTFSDRLGNKIYSLGAPTGSGKLPGSSASSLAASENSSMGSIPGSAAAFPNYYDRGIGAVGDIRGISIQGPAMPVFGDERLGGAATDPNSYFALSSQPSTGLAPGTTAIGSMNMPLPGAINTLNAINANPNLSPTMLGGQQNAGFFTDRMGNRIYSPGMPGYAKGGEVDLAALAKQNAETLSDEAPEDVINTDPVGTAQQMLTDLGNLGKSSPTGSSVKRKRVASGGRGASADKAMKQEYESLSQGDLGAMKDFSPKTKNTNSARAQLESMVRDYQNKARSAQERAKGFSSNTFGAPTLEGPTLTKGTLTARRFEEGGEVTAKEEEDLSKPAFLTPKSGKGRKEGNISKQLKSGDAYINMAKGVTELPYDIAGAPVDIATMLMRPFGYSTEKPVMGSDFIKEKMTKLGVRPEPPADPTAKGFYTAGQLLSNLTNPAGVVRTGVKGAQKVGQAATDVGKDFQEYNRQLSVPGASYAVRPTGSTMLSGPVGMKEDVSGIDKLLSSGLANATRIADRNEGQANIMRDFWDKKARNYFTRQFGTPDDPIATAISKKQIKGTALDEVFPEYMIDQLGVGKTRVNAEGQERFFPKYPKAMEDFTKRYDQATGIKGGVISLDPAAASPKYSNLLSDEGRLEGLMAQYKEQDKLLAQGVRPELINTEVGTVTRSALDKSRVIGDGPDSAKALLNAYEESKQFGKMDEPQKTSWINQIFGEGRKILGKNEEDVGKNLLPQNVKTAIDKGEPVYDVDFMRAPLTNLFDPVSINKYLASIPPREAANIRFEDAVKGGLKLKEKAAEMENVVSRIKSGKPVADTVFSKGVSAPLLQIDNGPFEGYAWKRIEKREATVPEGAYVGHSVGGYETGGMGYSPEKREGFNTGRYQVYTLRDNRNRPVNTIEVQMVDEFTPVVMQIKGNGRATGNTAPEKYDSAVLQFFNDYLRPAAINEKDEYLTPLLQTYKEGINANFKMP